jgi:hypothetical protein
MHVPFVDTPRDPGPGGAQNRTRGPPTLDQIVVIKLERALLPKRHSAKTCANFDAGAERYLKRLL